MQLILSQRFNYSSFEPVSQSLITNTLSLNFKNSASSQKEYFIWVPFEVREIPNSRNSNCWRKIQEKAGPIPNHIKGIQYVVQNRKRNQRLIQIKQEVQRMYGYLKYSVAFFIGLAEQRSTSPSLLNSMVQVGLQTRDVSSTRGLSLISAALTLMFSYRMSLIWPMLKRGAFVRSFNPCDKDFSERMLMINSQYQSINMVCDQLAMIMVKISYSNQICLQVLSVSFNQEKRWSRTRDQFTMQKSNNFSYITNSQQLQICNLIDKCKHIVRQDRLYLRNIVKSKQGGFSSPQQELQQQQLIKIVIDLNKPLSKMHMYQRQMKQLEVKLRKYVTNIKKMVKQQQISKMKENVNQIVGRAVEINKQKQKNYIIESRSRVTSHNNYLQNRENMMIDSRSNSISNTSKSGKSKSSSSHRKYKDSRQPNNIARNNPNRFDNTHSRVFVRNSNNHVDQKFRDISFLRNQNSSSITRVSNSQNKFRGQISSALNYRQNKSLERERQRPKLSQPQTAKAVASKSQWNLKLRQNQTIYSSALKNQRDRSPIREKRAGPDHIRIQNHSLAQSNSNRKMYLDSIRNDQVIEEVSSYRQIDNQKQKSYINAHKMSTRTQKFERQISVQQKNIVNYSPLFERKRIQKQEQRVSLARSKNKPVEHRKSRSKDDFPVSNSIFSSLMNREQIVSIPTQNQQFYQQNKDYSYNRTLNSPYRNVEQLSKGNQRSIQRSSDYDNKFSFRENSLKIQHQVQQRNPTYLLNSRAASTVSQSYEQSNMKIKAMLQGSRRIIDQFEKQKQKPIVLHQSKHQNSYTVSQSKYAGSHSNSSDYLLRSFKEKKSISLGVSKKNGDSNAMQFHSFKPSVDFEYSESQNSYRNFDGNKFREIQMTSSLFHQNQRQAKQQQKMVHTISNNQSLFTSPQLLQQCRNFMKKSKKSSQLFYAKPLQFPPIQETNVQNQTSQRQSFADGQPTCYNLLRNLNENQSNQKHIFDRYSDTYQRTSSDNMELNSFRQRKITSTNPFETSISPLRTQSNPTTAQQIIAYFFKGQNSSYISCAKFKSFLNNLSSETQNLLNILTYRHSDISIYDVAALLKGLQQSASLSKDLLAILDLDVSHRQVVTPSNIQIFLQNLSAVGLQNFNQIEACIWRVFRKAVQSDRHAKQISQIENKSQIGYWHLYYLQINEDLDFKNLCQTLGEFQFQIEIQSEDDQ